MAAVERDFNGEQKNACSRVFVCAGADSLSVVFGQATGSFSGTVTRQGGADHLRGDREGDLAR